MITEVPAVLNGRPTAYEQRDRESKAPKLDANGRVRQSFRTTLAIGGDSFTFYVDDQDPTSSVVAALDDDARRDFEAGVGPVVVLASIELSPRKGSGAWVNLHSMRLRDSKPKAVNGSKSA